MRGLSLTLLAACFALCSGCLLRDYQHEESNRRMLQLTNQSETGGQISPELAHYWEIDQPSHLVDDRVEGGVAPN